MLRIPQCLDNRHRNSPEVRFRHRTEQFTYTEYTNAQIIIIIGLLENPVQLENPVHEEACCQIRK
jgi:hypothetical protein